MFMWRICPILHTLMICSHWFDTRHWHVTDIFLLNLPLFGFNFQTIRNKLDFWMKNFQILKEISVTCSTNTDFFYLAIICLNCIAMLNKYNLIWPLLFQKISIQFGSIFCKSKQTRKVEESHPNQYDGAAKSTRTESLLTTFTFCWLSRFNYC